MGAQNQSVRSIETQLETLLLAIYHLNGTEQFGSLEKITAFILRILSD